jgi:hypothetical protein
LLIGKKINEGDPLSRTSLVLKLTPVLGIA